MHTREGLAKFDALCCPSQVLRSYRRSRVASLAWMNRPCEETEVEKAMDKSREDGRGKRGVPNLLHLASTASHLQMYRERL